MNAQTLNAHADQIVEVPNQLSVTHRCGHHCNRRIPYSHMVSPKTMAAYLEFLADSPCASCLERSAYRIPQTDERGLGLMDSVEAALRGLGTVVQRVARHA